MILILQVLIYNGILLNFCTINDMSSKHQKRDKKRYRIIISYLIMGYNPYCFADILPYYRWLDGNKTTNPNASPIKAIEFGFIFSGRGRRTWLARLRAFGRSRSQQSTRLLLCTARPSSPSLGIQNKNGLLTESVFALAGAEGLEPSARGFGVVTFS